MSTPTICTAILAWGGMHGGNRSRLLKSGNKEWLCAADDIRHGKLDRKEAYTNFTKLKDDGKLKGIGPAYFTKLIYFLMPRDSTVNPPGHIMGQWAGCSTNLLTDQQTVLMDVTRIWKNKEDSSYTNSSFIVSNANTGCNYEEFCSVVDSLSCRLDKHADEVDQALVSVGGKYPKSWRRYVKKKRCKKLTVKRKYDQ